ncbi:MAG: preprotein translocase subunit SecG [Muribaculaceae bacterium]|nr:preprotein translocase subunit SecG [Muribaculaceae bacterium]
MYTLVIILTVIAAILLIGVVLVQKSKGGGLASSFAGSNQIMGVRRTNDFIEKTTWTLAAVICVLAIASVFLAPPITTGSRIAPATPAATSVMEFPTQAAQTEAPAAETTEAPAAAETPAAE